MIKGEVIGDTGGIEMERKRHARNIEEMAPEFTHGFSMRKEKQDTRITLKGDGRIWNNEKKHLKVVLQNRLKTLGYMTTN